MRHWKNLSLHSSEKLNCQRRGKILCFILILVQNPVKITGSNIVVFCMLITMLNTFLITMQNVCIFYSNTLNIKISLFFQIFKAVATIRGQEKYKDINIYLHNGKYFMRGMLL